ncbi:MAG: hypothetical protein QM477_11735 [Planctomycetota bacterium]
MNSLHSLVLYGIACFTVGTAGAFAQNSVEKIREAPSVQANSVGTAIEWRTDLKTAVQDAKKANKPIFWYVHTLDGSFMDRKSELDRYMMGGPFSWPRMIQMLQEDYIPLRLAADQKLCKKYNLKVVQFIEPGILILSSSGKEQFRVDRISTMHPGWFQTQFKRSIKVASNFPGLLSPELCEQFYRTFPALDKGDKIYSEALANLSPQLQVEALWLYAAGLHDLHKESTAREILQQMQDQFPEHPMAAKAALELEGHGPYWRGFESYDELPAEALSANFSGTLAPAGTFDREELEQRAVAFLQRTQMEDGAWRDSRYDFGGTDSMPNVYAAITAINARGLLGKDAATEAMDQALSFLASDKNLNLEDRDELIWVYLYRIQLYCALLDRPLQDGDEANIHELLVHNVDAMVGMQSKNGSWFHEYENPFVTASCLLALFQASEHGVTHPDLDKIVERGLIPLEKSRSKKGAYSYYLGNRSSRIEASVGRTPVGELARFVWGEAKKKDLIHAVSNSFRDQEPLFLARKYDDHTNMYAYGGFFFWYSMLVRTQTIVALPEGKQRAKFMQQQRELVLALPEIDGAFIDSHELGRSYGTGMALWCLDLLSD